MFYRCDYCTRSFLTPSALQFHISSIHAPHPYCETCIEWFDTQALFEHHLATSPEHCSHTTPTFSCTQCSLAFKTPRELEKHSQSCIPHRYTVGRFYCDDCVLWFSDQDALDRHLQDTGEHASQFGCVECGREFNSRRELEAHLLMGALCNYGVGKESIQEEDEYENAYENARNQAALNMFQEGLKVEPFHSSHSNEGSVINEDIDPSDCVGPTYSPWSPVPASSQYISESPSTQASSEIQTYQCLGQTCLRTFKSPSALLQHLDSGACSSGINRHIVNSATISLDHGSAITNRLLRAAAGRNIHEVDIGPDEEEADIATRYLSQAPPGAPIRMGRPGLPWTPGDIDELPNLSCPQCRNSFRTAKALHEHMNSPVHDARIYHCSNTSGGLAGNNDHSSRNFSTLGALAQHLESKGCAMRVPAGAMIFNETLREVKEKLREVGMENYEGGVKLRGLEW